MGVIAKATLQEDWMISTPPAGLQIYAVSTLVRTRCGRLEHGLHIIEAGSLDAAEGRVLTQSVAEGRRLCGLLTRSCSLDLA